VRWHTGRFTIVMATGITSAAMRAAGPTALGAVASCLLVVLAGGRLQHDQGPVAHDHGAAGLSHGLGREV
jgi:hypothetical protein